MSLSDGIAEAVVDELGIPLITLVAAWVPGDNKDLDDANDGEGDAGIGGNGGSGC